MGEPPPSKTVVIIPARLGSTRLPGKVLLDRTGRPLIQHVWEAARGARAAGEVVVATDDARVEAAVRGFGGRAVMTRAHHPNGTSRLAEAAGALGLGPDDLVVNVQGDEPELEPGAIDAAVGALVGTAGASIGTVATPFAADEDPRDPNCVKVVRDLAGRALYFSRAAVPVDRDGRGDAASRPLRHVGLYAYRRAFLDRYASMEPTPLERAEQLEQLRALENGHVVAVAVVASARVGIDTAEQYEAFVARWRARAGR